MAGSRGESAGNCFLFLTELDSKREHIPHVRNKLEGVLISRVQKNCCRIELQRDSRSHGHFIFIYVQNGSLFLSILRKPEKIRSWEIFEIMDIFGHFSSGHFRIYH